MSYSLSLLFGFPQTGPTSAENLLRATGGINVRLAALGETSSPVLRQRDSGHLRAQGLFSFLDFAFMFLSKTERTPGAAVSRGIALKSYPGVGLYYSTVRSGSKDHVVGLCRRRSRLVKILSSFPVFACADSAA
jgi:hypothetical protein